MQRAEERHAVFPSGKSDGDDVPVFYHIIILHAAADQTGKLFHMNPQKTKFEIEIEREYERFSEFE